MNPPPKRSARPSGFTFSSATAPRVQDNQPPPAVLPPVETPGSPDAPAAKTSRSPDVKTSDTKPLAYTWRITPDQADTMDDLVRHVRRQLGVRRLDRATVLDGLVTIATEKDEVRAALIAHLRERRPDV